MVSSSSAALIFAVVGSPLLQGMLVAVGADWVKMSRFCNAVNPKLSSNQAKRDYILGSKFCCLFRMLGMRISCLKGKCSTYNNRRSAAGLLRDYLGKIITRTDYLGKRATS